MTQSIASIVEGMTEEQCAVVLWVGRFERAPKAAITAIDNAETDVGAECDRLGLTVFRPVGAVRSRRLTSLGLQVRDHLLKGVDRG